VPVAGNDLAIGSPRLAQADQRDQQQQGECVRVWRSKTLDEEKRADGGHQKVDPEPPPQAVAPSLPLVETLLGGAGHADIIGWLDRIPLAGVDEIAQVFCVRCGDHDVRLRQSAIDNLRG
jgi:hypothetical protein